MKINPEQIYQIRKQEQGQQVKPQKSHKEFGRMLDEEMNTSEKSTSGAGNKSAENISSSTYAQLSLFNNSSSESAVMNDIDDLLSKWEKYSAQLNSSQSSLKEMYAGLEEVSQSIRNIKDNIQMDKQSPELRNMLNELEVMTTTEKFKFNRGDYLP